MAKSKAQDIVSDKSHIQTTPDFLLSWLKFWTALSHILGLVILAHGSENSNMSPLNIWGGNAEGFQSAPEFSCLTQVWSMAPYRHWLYPEEELNEGVHWGSRRKAQEEMALETVIDKWSCEFPWQDVKVKTRNQKQVGAKELT